MGHTYILIWVVLIRLRVVVTYYSEQSWFLSSCPFMKTCCLLLTKYQWPLCNCRYSRGGTLYTHLQTLPSQKKNFSPFFYFSWTNGHERLITQQYYHLLFLGLVRIPVLHNLFWWKPLVFLENRRFSKTLVICSSFSFFLKQKVF